MKFVSIQNWPATSRVQITRCNPTAVKRFGPNKKLLIYSKMSPASLKDYIRISYLIDIIDMPVGFLN